MSTVQVAKLAKVSQATVSRVINNLPNVTEETAQQVRAAMKKLQFQPRLRRTNRKPAGRPAHTGYVALVFFGIEPAFLRLSVIAHLISGVQHALEARGYSLVLGRGEELNRVPDAIQQGRADAVLAGGFIPDPLILAELQRRPILWLLSGAPDRVDNVLPDDWAIGDMAAKYLAQRGCKRVAFVNPMTEHPLYVMRGQAFATAARDAGMDVSMIGAGIGRLIGVWTPAEGAAAVERVVQQLIALDPRPQGIFVPADELTAHVAGALERRGVKFGAFTTVSCNNDETWLPLLHPRPATIDPRMETIGAWAIELLLRQRSGLTTDTGIGLTVPPVLVLPKP